VGLRVFVRVAGAGGPVQRAGYVGGLSRHNSGVGKSLGPGLGVCLLRVRTAVRAGLGFFFGRQPNRWFGQSCKPGGGPVFDRFKMDELCFPEGFCGGGRVALAARVD